jgi:hypothetical protein
MSSTVRGGGSPRRGTAAGGSVVAQRRRDAGRGPAAGRCVRPVRAAAEGLPEPGAEIAVGRAWHCASRPRPTAPRGRGPHASVDRAVPTLCGPAASQVAAGNWPTDLVSSFLFSDYIQIFANSKMYVGFI